ncbi:uncharacterized protein [Blastocystis hominis]|uniref:Uncharacterized protein n=1 Tax=Blastocystis hominis TaxID=12968 RepID=D8MBP6_BLAHO|nr:uncharacterized protein [Blastocystis hominis]CBK25485.2 unnamed protein product [Blastocystis hominis]|eukprot:XP_012899533.1 uncharacterized protein [Blastocystis hominis]
MYIVKRTKKQRGNRTKNRKKNDGKYGMSENSDSSVYRSHAGRWSSDEQDLFIKGIFLYGNDWRSITSLINTRTMAQVRSHAQKYYFRAKREMDYILVEQEFFKSLRSREFEANKSKLLPFVLDYSALDGVRNSEPVPPAEALSLFATLSQKEEPCYAQSSSLN